MRYTLTIRESDSTVRSVHSNLTQEQVVQVTHAAMFSTPDPYSTLSYETWMRRRMYEGDDFTIHHGGRAYTVTGTPKTVVLGTPARCAALTAARARVERARDARVSAHSGHSADVEFHDAVRYLHLAEQNHARATGCPQLH